MRNKILVSTLVVFFGLAAPSFAANLLSNGNFELGINSNWTQTGPNWEGQGSVVYQGAVSAKNTVTEIPGFDYYASLTQVVNASAGTTYYATSVVKSDFNVQAKARVGMEVRFLNASNVVLQTAKDEIGGQVDWRDYLYVAHTAPAGTAKIEYALFVFASQAESAPGGLAHGSRAYFDLAVLDNTLIAPPAHDQLINAGFENFLVDWEQVYAPALAIENTEVIEGNHSIKNTFGVISGQDFFSGAYQDLDYLGGSVCASAQFKTAIAPAHSTAIAGVKLEFYNSVNTKIGETEQTITGTNNWTKLIINTTTPPAGTNKVRYLVFNYNPQGQPGAGDFVYVDDAVFSYSCPIPGGYQDDLLNEDFESGLTFWKNLYGFPATTSGTAHSGLISAQKTIGVVPNEDYYSQVYQDIYYNDQGAPFPQDQDVFATAYVKTDYPINQSVAGLQLEFLDNQNQVIGDPVAAVVGGQTDWRYVYVNGTVPAGGAAKARISGVQFAAEAESAAGGDAYYDDFAYSLTGLPQPPPQRKLVNTGFENGLHDWNQENKPGRINSTNPLQGNYAAEFVIDDSVTGPLAEDYFGSLSQEIKTTGHLRRLRASAWVDGSNIDPLTNTTATLAVDLYDGNNQFIIGYVDFVGTTAGWQRLSINRALSGAAATQTRKIIYTLSVFGPANNATVGDNVLFDDSALEIITIRSKAACTVGTPC